MGCIRATDEAMTAMANNMLKDHLTHILAQNNHVQHNMHRDYGADSHLQAVRGFDGFSGRSTNSNLCEIGRSIQAWKNEYGQKR